MKQKEPDIFDDFYDVIRNLPKKYSELSRIFPPDKKPRYSNVLDFFIFGPPQKISMWIYLYCYFVLERRWEKAEPYIVDEFWKCLYKSQIIDKGEHNAD